MNLRHRLARSRSRLVRYAAVIVVTFCGCADMLPSDETMEKWSPSNIWYRMQPNQLNRLNEGSGLPSDVYYSISDYPERNAATGGGATSQTSVIQPIDNPAAVERP
jgi:hypothetical protein